MYCRKSIGGTSKNSKQIPFVTPAAAISSITRVAYLRPPCSRSPGMTMGPRDRRLIAARFAARLAGLRNTGLRRSVRCVQVVAELPQVTHSKAQPFSGNTMVVGLRSQPLNGSTLAKSR
jgi:hypothetical protein